MPIKTGTALMEPHCYMRACNFLVSMAGRTCLSLSMGKSQKLIVRHVNGQQRGNSMLSFVFLSDNGNERKLGSWILCYLLTLADLTDIRP